MTDTTNNNSPMPSKIDITSAPTGARSTSSVAGHSDDYVECEITFPEVYCAIHWHGPHSLRQENLAQSIINDRDGTNLQALRDVYHARFKSCAIFDKLIISSYLGRLVHDTKCACKGADPKFWKKHHSPDLIKGTPSKLSFAHVYHVLDSLNEESFQKILDIVEICVGHAIINPTALLSNASAFTIDSVLTELKSNIAPTPEVKHLISVLSLRSIKEIKPHMFSLGSLVNTDSAVDSLKELLSSGININSSGLENLASVLEGINSGPLPGAAQKLAFDGLRVDMPDVSALNETLQGGVKVEHSIPFFDSLLQKLASFAGPFSTLFTSFKDADPRCHNLLALLTIAGLESVRIKQAPNSKWFNLIVLANAAIAYKWGGSIVIGLLLGYYGHHLFTNIIAWMKSDEDDDEKINIAPHLDEHTGFYSKVVMAIITVVTGITNAVHIREILLGLSSYKAFMLNGQYFIDSIMNIAIDIVNLMGSPFGLKIFRKAYSRYPQLFSITDTLNTLKDKLSKSNALEKRDVDSFIDAKKQISALELIIPINSEHSVYRNALMNLKKMIDSMEDVMRGRGFLSSRRRMAPFTVTLAGCSGSAKTRIADVLADNIMYARYGEEEMERMKSFKDAYYYSMKAGKKHHDSYTQSVRVVKIDDIGQMRKPTDPQMCPWVNLVFMGNNEPYTLECANLINKDKNFYCPEVQILTTNLKKYNDDNSHCVEKEAPIRRMESNNNCIYAIEPLDKYRAGNGGNFGYSASADLKSKIDLDTEAFYVRRLDFRTGEFAGEPMTWETFSNLVVANSKQWFEDEAAKMRSDDDSWKNARMNPGYKPLFPDCEAHMDDDPRTRVEKFIDPKGRQLPPTVQVSASSTADVKFSTPALDFSVLDFEAAGVSREAMEKLFALQQKKKKIPMYPVRSEYKSFDDFIAAYWNYHRDRSSAYVARGGGNWFCTELNRLIWSEVGGEKWSIYYMKWSREIDAAISKYYEKWPPRLTAMLNMWFSKETLTHLSRGAAPPHQYFLVYVALMKDIIEKSQRLSELTQLGVQDIMAKWHSTRSLYDFISNSWPVVVEIYSATMMTAMDTMYASLAVLCLDNYWVRLLGSIATGVILATKAVEIAAQADYQKLGTVLKDPMRSKCKHSKMKRNLCGCTECSEFRSSSSLKCSISGAPKSSCSCSACVKPIAAHIGVFSENAEEKIKGITKRNVWNMQVLRSKSDTSPILCMNILMIATQLGVTNDHFVHTCDAYASKYPGLIVRFVSWDNSRYYDTAYRSMHWDRYGSQDKAYWINTGLSSFGGGLRNIVNFIISEYSPEFSHARLVKLKYDRDTKLTEYQLVAADVGRKASVFYKVTNDIGETMEYKHEAYSLAIETSVGMCGGPLVTADAAVKESKIFGILCGGDIHKDSGRSNSYAAGLTREEVLRVLEKNTVDTFNTDSLPYGVTETEILPHGCIAIDVRPDAHSVAMHSDIKKTPLHGCLGDIDRIPTFIAPWVNGEGVVFDPLNMTRKKYVTNGPAINADLYQQAVVMFATNITSNLGPGPRARRLTTKEALEGAHDEARFSTTTSPGGRYILQGITKKDIVRLDGDKLDFSSPQGQSFLEDVEKATYERENHIISLAITNEFAKSEVLPIEKVKLGKARLVDGDDADQVVADKKELGCLSYCLKKVSIATGCCIGKDPLSGDYDLMARLLLVWNSIVGGDHSGWDTTYFRHKFMGFLMFSRIVLFDASPEHWRAIETCVENMMYRIHMAHITYDVVNMCEVKKIAFYELLHTMISGSYITLIGNTVAHSIDVRYIILCNYVENKLGVSHMDYSPMEHGMLPIMTIERNMVAFILGDDIAISISPDLYFITFDTLRYMYALHNMKFTTDTKENTSEGYYAIKRYDAALSKFGFCKRSVRWSHEYQRYVWALEKDSLLKSIYFSEDFSDYRQIIDGFLRELSLHGRETFQSMAPKLNAKVLYYYSYASPFAVYEIALMAAVGGISRKVGEKLYLSIIGCELTLDDESLSHAFKVSKYEFDTMDELEQITETFDGLDL